MAIMLTKESGIQRTKLSYFWRYGKNNLISFVAKHQLKARNGTNLLNITIKKITSWLWQENGYSADKIKSEKGQYKKLLDKLKRSGGEMPSKDAIEQECRHFKILHRILGSSDKANPRFILDPLKRTLDKKSAIKQSASLFSQSLCSYLGKIHLNSEVLSTD